MADTNYNKVQAQMEENKPSKVIKGTAKLEKRSFSKKLIDFLFSDKIDSIGNYLTYEVLGPSLRNMAYQLGMGALQMTLFGNSRPPVVGPPSQQSSGARRDYGAYSNQGYAAPPPPPVAAAGYRQRIMPNDISFDSADDALLVLDRMRGEIGRYGKVFLRHYYEFSGITGQLDNWTLGSYGWYDLNYAHPIQRTDGRWMIDFPDPQMIR